MARQIDRSQIGSQGEVLPKLTAEMIAGNKTVLTIDGARQVPGRFGHFLAVKFQEFPEHEMITNATMEDSLLALVDANLLPSDMDQWPGYRVAFVKRENINPESKLPVSKLYAMDPTDQATAIAEFDRYVVEEQERAAARATAPTAPRPKGSAPAGESSDAGKGSGKARR